MLRIATVLALGLAVLLAPPFFGDLVSAKDAEQPPGEPPFGTAVKGDAPGTKLYGSIFIGLLNVSPAADVVVVLRLRHGNQLETFYGQTGVANAFDPAVVQQAIINVMAPKVLARFFPGQSGLTVTVKDLTEFGQYTLTFGEQCIFGFFTSCIVDLADVTLAVQ